MILKLGIFIIFISINLNSYGFDKNDKLLLGSPTDILLIKDDNSVSPDLIYNDIGSLGYNVNVAEPSLLTLDFVNQHRLVILSCGANNNPCASNNMRFILESYLDNGGNLIIEGGEIGYAATVYPQFPGFKNKVLKIANWFGHNGGDLIISDAHLHSNLANVPNILPAMVRINFSQNTDQDVCSNGEFSELFYKTTLFENNIGILVAPSVNNPKIINFSFNYSAVTFRSDAKNLLANSIFNLIGYSVGMNSVNQEIPTGFNLYQNFPNPFNPSTTIQFDILKSTLVNLSVYDALGVKVYELVNEHLLPGKYEYDFHDKNTLTSGVYLYKIKTSSFESTKKMLFIK